MAVKGNIIDRVGETNKQYTIIAALGFKVNKDGSRVYMWLCPCECGKERRLPYMTFKKYGSCGCEYQSRRGKRFEIFRAAQIGKEIKGWEIVEFKEHKNKEAVYVCKCIKCGAFKDYALKQLNEKKYGARCNKCTYVSKYGNQEVPWGFVKNHRKQYGRWLFMNQRCELKSSTRYGARGISVCREWEQKNPLGFVNYVTWMKSKYPDYEELMDLGFQVDRKDNNKGYSPENCRLVSVGENAKNKETSIRVSYLGEEGILLADLVREFSLNPLRLVAARFKSGWDLERAMITPKQTKYISKLK